MSWVRDSDDVYDDEALLDVGKDPAFLWSIAMRECAKKDGDGVLSTHMITAAAAKFGIKRPPAEQALVAAGLWHDEDGLKRCGECRDLCRTLPSSLHRFIHGWRDHLLDAAGKDDKIHRALDMARRALRRGKDRELLADIRRRDNDECQYCGVVTRWVSTQDRRSKDLGEPDHVDRLHVPLNDPENVVVACKGCNADKKGRNPAQWHAAGGRLLRRAPGKNTPTSWVDHGPITDPALVGAPAITDPPRVARDSGPGPDPIKADPGSGPSGPDPSRHPAPSTNGNGHHA